MATEFSNETDAKRYAMRIDGELVGVLDYSILGGSISLTRAFTTPAKRGNGYAAQLVEYAVNDIEANTELKIVPMCWYVADWFEAHQERSGLLARRAG
ncbi:acetyltransferase [Leifsonia sp. Root227]|jgi:predicted GNAT family acetyltransferase|uniref:GNAT family N-acetyltransferase n=1 Tax=unclassified Leifsonia TaxID=2663824 RepID=UPI0006F32EAF|nr:GNAT family N-acetyltransferase [Leifsonia sp. Root227]KRC51751.1 acetyltransferase [Leifsonia sp. Root227]